MRVMYRPAGLTIILCVGFWLASSAAFADDFFRRTQFRRADSNTDGAVDISDSLFTLNSLFVTDEPARCLEAMDANDDDFVDVSDPIFTLNYLFVGGSATPPAPGPNECGAASQELALGCDEYELCPDDTTLIFHVLSRITFGPTEELMTEIQTRDDLLDYIDEQLNPPENYDPTVHEPELQERIDALEIGFVEGDTARAPVQRLKSMLIENAVHSRWQLLHVVSQFWNNHFHTNVGSLSDMFFRRNGRGGAASRGNAEFFAVADSDVSGFIDEAEWIAFRAEHPSLIEFAAFGRRVSDDNLLSFDEFNNTAIAFWKYGRGFEGLAVASDMEKREYDLYRRLSFGSFGDLLEACMKSVAMLIYLNGFENTAAEPNENLSREFFELHGAGVDHIYTQRDIEELSRVLTAWTADWVERAQFDPNDLNFQGHPTAERFRINFRAPRPFNFPTQENWDDTVYTWAFVFGNGGAFGNQADFGHDWNRKDLFLQRYGGVDSLGNPPDPSLALTIPANLSDHTAEAALAEFDLVLGRVVSFRDTAKFISTKLIQLFVTDDLAELKKTYPMPADLQVAFDSVDSDGDGAIELSEWEEPIPLVLPNGRPREIFDRIDENGNQRISPLEYQEPDLLLDAIDTWRATGGDMREVIRGILLSEEFFSLDFYRAKVKTPFESVVSSARALEGEFPVDRLIVTVEDLTIAGMELFDFGDPTGESELGFDLMHTIGLLERLKFLNRAANPATNNESRFSWNPLEPVFEWQLGSAESIVDFFALLLHGADILDAHRELTIQAMTTAGSGTAIQRGIAFLLSLPQFHKQ